MQRHFQKELESLKTSLIRMASLVEDCLNKSTMAVFNRDTALAESVVHGDARINSIEIEIDNAIVDLLALQQPVAVDLRLILSAQKINNDLERLGDHAVNIAESALALSRLDPPQSFVLLPRMSDLGREMLRDAIDSFIHRDPDLGQNVLQQDDTMDQLNREMTSEIISLMKGQKLSIDLGIELIRVSKNFERVADLATNIAEEVIFVIQARVVKHHADEASTKPHA